MSTLFRQLKPKLLTVLAEGYSAAMWRRDALAGLTVAVVALPLAVAIAIASGVTPQSGLLTAVVAGFLVSLLGGSRVQIGGPTGAFIPVVALIISQHGVDGLLLATAMAGVILIIAALLRLGTWMKYIPHPVITGFTAGIAVIIASSQLKDFFGLSLASQPAEFLPKLAALWSVADTVNWTSVTLACGVLAVVLMCRRWFPRSPGLLIAIVLAAAVVWVFALPVSTIGSQFGALSFVLPTPGLPALDIDRLRALLPVALTIAFLAGIESLLSATVADGMLGSRHRPNAELLAQGVANTASALLGGLPATGAIARTATNVRSGGASPLAGIFHAVFVLVLVLALGPLLERIPLPALAAVLMIVAWNMAEFERIVHYRQSPIGDAVILCLTFGLTVLADLSVAIEVGLVAASLLFMHRMARSVTGEQGSVRWSEDDDAASEQLPTQRRSLLPGMEAFQIRGPLFFGMTSLFDEVLSRLQPPPRVFILRMSLVPIVDASGVYGLSFFIARLRGMGVLLVLSGLQSQPKHVLGKMGIQPQPGVLEFAENYLEAVEIGRVWMLTQPGSAGLASI